MEIIFKSVVGTEHRKSHAQREFTAGQPVYLFANDSEGGVIANNAIPNDASTPRNNASAASYTATTLCSMKS